MREVTQDLRFRKGDELFLRFGKEFKKGVFKHVHYNGNKFTGGFVIVEGVTHFCNYTDMFIKEL